MRSQTTKLQKCLLSAFLQETLKAEELLKPQVPWRLSVMVRTSSSITAFINYSLQLSCAFALKLDLLSPMSLETSMALL
jgi:hypothetical protein